MVSQVCVGGAHEDTHADPLADPLADPHEDPHEALSKRLNGLDLILEEDDRLIMLL